MNLDCNVNIMLVSTEIFSFLEGMERRTMLKLERMHEDLRNGNGRVMEAVESRPGRTSEAAEEDMLEGPCQNLADLEDLCKKIADRSFKKKMVCPGILEIRPRNQ